VVSFLLTTVFHLFLVEMTRAVIVLTVFMFILAFLIVLSSVSEVRTPDLLVGTAA
jgi:hypothetical protein